MPFWGQTARRKTQNLTKQISIVISFAFKCLSMRLKKESFLEFGSIGCSVTLIGNDSLFRMLLNLSLVDVVVVIQYFGALISDTVCSTDLAK